uniref:Uncharacterized protein n=1 Tax=Oryza punctata TaxID=4537 RepID=A0A0E0MKE9_ORYPU
MFGESSVFTLQHLIFPPYSLASSSITGAIILHGPHHGAQNSTSTGASLPSTMLSQFFSSATTTARVHTMCSCVATDGNMTNGCIPSSTALLHWQAKREAGRSGDGEVTDSLGLEYRLLLPARRSLSLLPPAARPDDGGCGACRVAQALKHVSNAIIFSL